MVPHEEYSRQPGQGSSTYHNFFFPHPFILVKPFVSQTAQVIDQAQTSIVSPVLGLSKLSPGSTPKLIRNTDLDQPPDLLKLAESMTASFSF